MLCNRPSAELHHPLVSFLSARDERGEPRAAEAPPAEPAPHPPKPKPQAQRQATPPSDDDDNAVQLVCAQTACRC